MLKLKLNDIIINECHALAAEIAKDVFGFLQSKSTIGIERAVLRLLGINGATSDELRIPYVNIICDKLQQSGVLINGAALYVEFLNECFNAPTEQWTEDLHHGRKSLPNLEEIDITKYKNSLVQKAQDALNRISEQSSIRTTAIQQQGEQPTPWLYVIVATGNIYEDLYQAELAAKQGADVIAVIRSTAQSLLDYVPQGTTTEGVAGTYATQENFRLMRSHLDKVGKELGKYTRLTNYASGLCMAEMAALGAMERLDMMLSDSMYGILYRDINMVRTFTDQHFARRVQAYAGIIINTGEDNYLTTSEQYDEIHTVLTSQFINRQFAQLSGMKDEQIGLGHAFEMDTEIENGFLLSMADALLSRTCFPDCPLKYMPPTKHIDGNIFFAHIINTLFNLCSIGTGQHIHLVGILSEAIHTPYIHERMLAIQNAKYVFNYAKDFAAEFSILDNGVMQQRAACVLKKTYHLLQQIKQDGLIPTIEAGKFGGISRSIYGGKGSEGVFDKSNNYFNPFENILP